jgi:hypothetical protein
MSDTRGEAEQLGPPVDLLDDLLGSARAHAATGDWKLQRLARWSRGWLRRCSSAAALESR